MTWAHMFTTHEFWTGGLVVGGLGSFTTYFSTRASDRRMAKQEEKMQARHDEREDKLRQQESLYTAAMEFVEVSTDILVTTIDIKGVFNAMRDLFNTRAGLDDPMAEAKFDHSEKVMDAQMRIGVPVNKLKLVAPVNILDSAMRASLAIMTAVRQTTQPFAKPVAYRAASDELNNFYNVFRQEVGREPYSDERAREQALSFMETLKKEVDDYMEEAKADMKAAGFNTTPWDNPRDKSAEPGRAAEEPSFLGPTPLVPVRSLNVGEDISLPIAQRGTGSIGLRSTIQSFNEERTQMTVFVQKAAKTLTIDVDPDQQFIRVAAPKAS
jgi:predicted metal-dependent hydrolase